MRVVLRLMPLLVLVVAADGAQATTLHAERVGRFREPVYVTSPPGTKRTLVVVERRGRVRLVVRGRILRRPLADLRKRVLVEDPDETEDQRGLFSVAFPRDYRRSGRFYVDYVDRSNRQRIDELRRGSRRVRPVLDLGPVTTVHHGGQLQFGPDGLLYVGLGDGGSGGDPKGNAQNLGTLLGKILRIDPRPSGDRPYTIPADNPFVGRAGARGEIWAYGLRNPWRFSFDAGTGALWIGDVGQGAREEVSAAAAGSKGGENYGWDRYEGTRPYEGGDAAGLVPPVYDYARSDGNCAVTGGYVYRGTRLAGLQGRYVFADFCRGEVLALVDGPGGTRARPLGPQVGSLASFGEDASHELYVLSLDGGVYRLDPAA